MSRAVRATLFAIVPLFACGSAHTLRSSLDHEEGFVIADREVVDVSNGDAAPYDFAMRVRTAIVLASSAGAGGGNFCAKGKRFERVDDIPTATMECVWSTVQLAGNGAADISVLSDTAFLVREADGEGGLALLIVDFDVDDDSNASLTFELAD